MVYISEDGKMGTYAWGVWKHVVLRRNFGGGRHEGWVHQCLHFSSANGFKLDPSTCKSSDAFQHTHSNKDLSPNRAISSPSAATALVSSAWEVATDPTGANPSIATLQPFPNTPKILKRCPYVYNLETFTYSDDGAFERTAGTVLSSFEAWCEDAHLYSQFQMQC